jgi:GNAT superfamily N-acetyltransferase
VNVPEPEVQVSRGAAVADLLPAVAGLRIRVFREWPYLYDGDEAHEREYLTRYARSDRTIIVTARDPRTGRIVGASTGLPLAEADEPFRRPFVAAGMSVAPIFYFGESVLLPEYRGLGIGRRFFDAREAHAAADPAIRTTAFCAVVRPAVHPARPSDYRSLEPFWRRRGYHRRDDLTCHLSWREIGEPTGTRKPLAFWLRDLPCRHAPPGE